MLLITHAMRGETPGHSRSGYDFAATETWRTGPRSRPVRKIQWDVSGKGGLSLRYGTFLGAAPERADRQQGRPGDGPRQQDGERARRPRAVEERRGPDQRHR